MIKKKELSRVYHLEEVYWRQNSRIQWLKEGDHNTQFFHGCTKTRKARNCIITLQDTNGIKQIGEEKISHIADDYFNNLFKSNDPVGWADILTTSRHQFQLK